MQGDRGQPDGLPVTAVLHPRSTQDSPRAVTTPQGFRSPARSQQLFCPCQHESPDLSAQLGEHTVCNPWLCPGHPVPGVPGGV